MLFSEKFGFSPETDVSTAIEASTIVNGDTVEIFYDPNASNIMCRAVSTDVNAFSWVKTPTTTLISPFRFHYVFKYNGLYYAVGCHNFSGGNVYMYKSTDGLSWSIINGGNPILTKSSNSSSIWYNIWNVAIAHHGNGKFILLAECGTQASQADVGLGYSYATMVGDNINFDANRTEHHVIPYGGNPDIKYLPDRNAFLVLHGMIHAPFCPFGNKDYWWFTASWADAAIDLSLASSWHTEYLRFAWGRPNIHVCDPHILELPPGKTSKLLLTYSDNQNSMHQIYADIELLEFFDLLRT